MQLLHRSPVSQFTGHLYHALPVMWSTDRKMDVLDKGTGDCAEPLIAPCINVTVCVVSHLSVKTVAQILHGFVVVVVIATLLSSEAASLSRRVGELTRRNDQAKC